jgi:hypothetical protein
MVRDKVKLRKLIDFISDIGSLQDNDWFIRELVFKVSDKDADKVTAHALNEIHEYCINNIIRRQAEGFYSGFVLSKITSQLIEDFVLMERFRREDNFEEFCFKINQQIEAIIKTIASNDFLQNITEKLNDDAYYFYDNKGGQIINSLGKLIYMNYDSGNTRIEWNYLQKIKAVLYVFWVKSNHKKEQLIHLKEFNEVLYFPARDIYLIRNLNHREGGLTFETESEGRATNKEKILEILNNKYRKYQQYSGFLYDFVRTIQNNY